MPSFSIAPTKEYKGIYAGKYAGNIWDTWNIDLEKQQGRIKLANKMRILSTVGLIRKFIRTNADTTDQWWGLEHNSNLNKNGNIRLSGGTWAADALASTPTDCRDMEIHEYANGEQRLVVSRATDIAILNRTGAANTWTAAWWSSTLSQSALTSSTYHPLARLQRLLSIGDKVSDVPVIHTIDKDDVVANARLTLPAGFTVNNSYASSDRFWYGLASDTGGDSKIIEWDGSALTYNNEYNLVGSYPLCGFIVDNIPYFITEYGYIYKYMGGSFEVAQSFYLNEDQQVFEGANQMTAENTIVPYGTIVDRHLVYILVGMPIRYSGTTSGGVHRGRSGIWVFNTKNFNLYHLMGLGQHTAAGTDIDYGHGLIDAPGALAQDILSEQNTILIGSAQVHTGGAAFDTGNQAAIYREVFNLEEDTNEGRNRGWFVTPYIPTQDIESSYQAIWAKFRRFRESANRIIIKWRTQDNPLGINADNASPSQASGLWTSTTTFNCAVPVGVAVGDEVEVLTGDNGGCCFNISALSATPDGSATIQVTIDEAAPTSSSDRCLMRFANWRSETAISDTSIQHAKVPLTRSSTANSGGTEGHFIQFKIELRGFSVEIDDIIAVYKTLTKADQA